MLKLLGRNGFHDAKVEEGVISGFKKIHGFSICIDSYHAFFPRHDFLNSSNMSALVYGREILSGIEFVYPPFCSHGFVQRFVNSIALAPKNEDLILAYTKEMFSLERLSVLFTEKYNSNKDISPFYQQILESLYAHCMGWHRVAVTSLIPCIEGVVRSIGVSLDPKFEKVVSAKDLDEILKLICKHVINRNLPKDAWVPDDLKSLDYHDSFDEQIQMVQSLRYFIKHKLYAHTDSYSSDARLNRNGVVHGFIDDYNSPLNFYRLIVVLNSLYVCSALAGRGGSLFFPSPTNSSRELLDKLNKINLAGLVVSAD
ncbi:MAG: hypothetical protein ACTH7C_08055 [Cobetia marina]